MPITIRIIVIFIMLLSVLNIQSTAQTVIQNQTISTTVTFYDPLSITVGPNVIITNSGYVTLEAGDYVEFDHTLTVEIGATLDVYTGVPTAIDEEIIQLPSVYQLNQNYPNPFNPVTTLSYQIPKSTFVTINIYNIAGKLVHTLVNESQNAGIYTVNWDASKFSSGAYFFRIETTDFIDVKKCILLK